MPDVNDWNKGIIAEFRANNGKVGGQFEGAPMVLITTTGAKSGLPRTNPLVCLPQPDGLVIFASKAGADTNPDWYHNLKANPEVTVEYGSETYKATAREVTGADRDRLYEEQQTRMPGFKDYAEKTTRLIPVISLDRVS